MALASSSTRFLCNTPNRSPYTQTPLIRSIINPTSSKKSAFTVSAKKQSPSSPRTGKFESKNRRTNPVTKEFDQDVFGDRGVADISGDGGASAVVDDGFVMPKLPGENPDFWEGEKWDPLGFFVEYMWAFGIVFAIISSGIAVATYNEGATDFKNTPVYKEAIQSQDLIEEPDTANSDVFESNPTEQAPSLE